MEKQPRINFDDLLGNHINRNSPDVEFIIRESKRTQEEGKVPDLQILQNALKFLADQSRMAMTDRVISLNKTIADAVTELAQLDRWSNLQSVAVSAMENAVTVVMKDGRRRITDSFRLKLSVLEASADQYPEMFKPEFLALFLDKE